jgi:hypothetical protein
VQESKDNTKRLLEDFKRDGQLPEQTLAVEGRGLKVYCDDETIQALGKNKTVEAFIAAHLKRVKPGDYIALLNFIRENDENEALIQTIRLHLRDALRVATTAGYGPRYLHSTGQLHKGGDDSGVFIQTTADDLEDAMIVGEPFTFGVLKQAQALGDFQALASRDRRAIRIHLGADIPAGLKTLLEIVRTAFPISKA